MKRILILFSIIIFAISCSKTETQNTQAGADNSLQKVKEKGKLV